MKYQDHVNKILSQFLNLHVILVIRGSIEVTTVDYPKGGKAQN